MKISELLRDVPRLFNTGLSLPALRRVRLFFHAPISPRKKMAGHAPFNRAHARFTLIKNKTSEIALIDLSDCNSSADYVATVKKTTLIDNSPLVFLCDIFILTRPGLFSFKRSVAVQARPVR